MSKKKQSKPCRGDRATFVGFRPSTMDHGKAKAKERNSKKEKRAKYELKMMC